MVERLPVEGRVVGSILGVGMHVLFFFFSLFISSVLGAHVSGNRVSGAGLLGAMCTGHASTQHEFLSCTCRKCRPLGHSAATRTPCTLSAAIKSELRFWT